MSLVTILRAAVIATCMLASAACAQRTQSEEQDHFVELVQDRFDHVDDERHPICECLEVDYSSYAQVADELSLQVQKAPVLYSLSPPPDGEVGVRFSTGVNNPVAVLRFFGVELRPAGKDEVANLVVVYPNFIDPRLERGDVEMFYESSFCEVTVSSQDSGLVEVLLKRSSGDDVGQARAVCISNGIMAAVGLPLIVNTHDAYPVRFFGEAPSGILVEYRGGELGLRFSREIRCLAGGYNLISTREFPVSIYLTEIDRALDLNRSHLVDVCNSSN